MRFEKQDWYKSLGGGWAPKMRNNFNKGALLSPLEITTACKLSSVALPVYETKLQQLLFA